MEIHHEKRPLAICFGKMTCVVGSLISLEFWSGALWQNVLPQDFATNSFIIISSGIRYEIPGTWVEATKSWTKFERFFGVAKCCGKTFCHKEKNRPLSRFDEILLCGKTVHFATKKISSKFRPNFRWNFAKLELKQRDLGRNFNDFLTTLFCGKGCGQMDCHEIFNEIFNETKTESSTKLPRIPNLLQIMRRTFTIYKCKTLNLSQLCLALI